MTHPALLQLTLLRMRAKFVRMLDSFRSPRKMWLSCIAIGLTIVWLGQAIAGILFRQSADPQHLAQWIPLGFLSYTLWHLVKTISVKPVEPFDWTPAEQEFLCAAPVSRSQLISYRMTSILMSAIVKSVCFSLLMIPDLQWMLAGWVGMLLGLLLVDLIRVVIELGCYALPSRVLWSVRTTIYLLIGCGIAVAFSECLYSPSAAERLASPGSLLFAQSIGEAVADGVSNRLSWLMLLFQPAANVIFATSVDGQFLIQLLISFGLVTLGALAVVTLDGRVIGIRQRRERQICQTKCRDSAQMASAGNHLGQLSRTVAGESVSAVVQTLSTGQPTILIPVEQHAAFHWRHGAATIAWRQLLGAWHYRSTLLVSLGVPVGLCCLPLLSTHNEFHMLLHVVCGLVFYSFLLLPSALMLDFRRDANRLSVLKALPVSPMAITIGQLFAPVLICVGFQWTVLLIGAFVGCLESWQILIAGILLVPICALIFSIENVIFMAHPFRQNQEGVAMFLRTILTFTAKGVFFGLGLALVVAWAFAAQTLTIFFGQSGWVAGLIFAGGFWLMVVGLLIASVRFLARQFEQFDPSLDGHFS